MQVLHLGVHGIVINNMVPFESVSVWVCVFLFAIFESWEGLPACSKAQAVVSGHAWITTPLLVLKSVENSHIRSDRGGLKAPLLHQRKRTFSQSLGQTVKTALLVISCSEANGIMTARGSYWLSQMMLLIHLQQE